MDDRGLPDMKINIPTAVTKNELSAMLSLASDRRVLEVGALLGFSTVNLAFVAEHVVSVDPHEGYPAHDPRPTLEPFLNNLALYGVRGKVTPMIGTHDQVFPFLALEQFNFAFIDCTGEFDLTLDILNKIMPLLSLNSYICVHDCGHPDWPGALEAVKEFRNRTGMDYQLVDRLAVFSK